MRKPITADQETIMSTDPTAALATLTPKARLRLRWGGYTPGEPATEELLGAGLIRRAPEHAHLAGPDAMVLTEPGADVFGLIFTQPISLEGAL